MLNATKNHLQLESNENVKWETAITVTHRMIQCLANIKFMFESITSLLSQKQKALYLVVIHGPRRSAHLQTTDGVT